MAKIKGYPVSIKMELYSKSDACPEQKQAEAERQEQFDAGNPVESAKDMLGGFFKKKTKEKVKEKFARDPNKPIFRYIYDVKDVAYQKEHDSRFMVPENFKMIDRR